MKKELYVITVKVPKNPQHDPHNKQLGECPYSTQCTDVTGVHHSFLGTIVDISRLHEEGVHITRTELVTAEQSTT